MPKINFKFIPFPVDIVDDGVDLSLGEYRLLGYILRYRFKTGSEIMRLSQDQLLRGVKRPDGSRRDKGCGITSPRDLKTAREKLVERGWIRTDDSRDGMLYEIMIDREDDDDIPDHISVSAKCTEPMSAKSLVDECILSENRVQNALPDNKEVRTIQNLQEGVLDPAPPVTPSIRPEEYANCWNRNRGPLSKVESFTDTRRKKILSRQRQGISLEMFERAVKHCATSPFLTGTNNQGWTATFDWLIANDSNAVKVLEGQYVAKENGGMKHASNGQLHSANRDVLNRVLGGPKAVAGGELPLRSIAALESSTGGRPGEVLAPPGDEVHSTRDQGRF